MAEKKESNKKKSQQTSREYLEAFGFEYVPEASSTVIFLSKEQLAILKTKPKQGS
jgi:hypothetical protein